MAMKIIVSAPIHILLVVFFKIFLHITPDDLNKVKYFKYGYHKRKFLFFFKNGSL